MATPYYGWILPTVGASADTWGGLLNAVITAQDTQLASPANTIKGNNTGSTAASINLTPAQVAAMLPIFTTSSRGAAPQSTAADSNRPLVGDGTYKKGIGRAAGALVNVTASSATLVAGSVNIASVTWADVDSSVATIAVVFSVAMANANYQVVAGSETAAGSVLVPGSVVTGSRTVNGFTFTYSKLADAITLSVFEA